MQTLCWSKSDSNRQYGVTRSTSVGCDARGYVGEGEHFPAFRGRSGSGGSAATLDPDTATPNPVILRKVTQGHDGTAGVYGAVLAEGIIRPGDPVAILD